MATVNPLAVEAASFDCGKARTKVEKAICDDMGLGILDIMMLDMYREVIRDHPLPDYIRARQREWLANRQYCKPEEFTRCLIEKYRTRLEDLNASRHALVYSTNEKFSYTAGDTVAELKVIKGKVFLSLWGSATINRAASEMAKKSIYDQCDLFIEVGPFPYQYAREVKIETSEDTLKLTPSKNDLCEGNSSIPESLIKQRGGKRETAPMVPSILYGTYTPKGQSCATEIQPGIDNIDLITIDDGVISKHEEALKIIEVYNEGKSKYRALTISTSHDFDAIAEVWIVRDKNGTTKFDGGTEYVLCPE
jgi:uncharacterized protein